MISGGMNLDPAESTHNTKVSESGCSNSGNSRSQWSGSGRSCLSSSSGYGTRGHSRPDVVAIKAHRLIKRAKDKNRKKKKIKCSTESIVTGSSLGENESFLASQTDNTDQQHQFIVPPTEAIASTSSPKEACDKKENSSCLMDSDTLKKSVRWTSPRPLDTKFEFQEPWVSVEDQFRNETSLPESDNGFCCVISLQDGAVLYTTPDITHSLGFPRDMWLGRSFIDFVHPRDRATFSNQITSNVMLALSDSNQKEQTNFLYVMLRKYRGLRNVGFCITKSSVIYQPYRLTLMFRKAPLEGKELTSSKSATNIILVICAQPVFSIYKEPNESLDNKQLRFSTRHTIGGILKYVDENSVKSIGYLPQDILGRSIMELYHPEDISIFKKACESAIIKGQITGSWVSQPCRFLIKNGCYIPLQTEWISFINPWNKEIEFIIGNHHVLRGPSNPDVFATGVSELGALHSFPEELLKEAKSVEEQIVQLLKRPIVESPSEKKQIFSKQCKTLNAFMEQIISEMTGSTLPSNSEFTSSKRDSMIIGEVSPHHEGLDSKTTSDTLLSYNQLNYNDNIQRFFDSCPVINVCDPLKPGSSTDVNLFTIGNKDEKRNKNYFQPRALTEELLYKHNVDMQKVMLKKHRDAQHVLFRGETPKDNFDKTLAPTESHGIKRGPSFSWEGDTSKSVKHQHNTNPKTSDITTAICTSTDPRDIIVTTTAVTNNPQLSSLSYALPRVGQVWPPIAVSVSSMQAKPSTAPSSFILATNHQSNNPNNPTPEHLNAFPLMTGVMCPQLQIPQQCLIYPLLMCQVMPCQSIPIPCAPATDDDHNQAKKSTVSRAVQVDVTTQPGERGGRAPSAPSTTSAPVCDFREPSQDSNFTRGSIAPALMLERTLVINVDGGFQLEDTDKPASRRTIYPPPEINDDMDILSLSSFYSSFLKTDNSSDSDDPLKRIVNDGDWDSASRVKRRPNPPWLDNVNLTKQLVYRYQVAERSLQDLLAADADVLRRLNQPILVNEQLDQLYLDLAGEGMSAQLALSETASGGTSSSCSDDGESSQDQTKFARQSTKYSKLMMIYEENAPFPPPLPTTKTQKV
ncbi:period circadian protein-like isoform X2 [Wyeomyia smithii]|uniref:period circadian protein-like isoform X2 n=1 Tax=Wyeomyia smithii TaxID=174621 RepID=UPI002468209D|nr:period circadian protein-like isoform X2 [Wyeomyia smithii]